MKIDFDGSEPLQVKFTEPDKDGVLTGFGRLDNGNIIVVTACPGDIGSIECITPEQAHSALCAMERMEAGYGDGEVVIAEDGMTERRHDA